MMLLSVPAYAETNGMFFSSEYSYQTEEPLSVLPVTFEATVKLPQDFTERAGVIIGNYASGDTPCLSFEVHKDGKPRIYYLDESKNTKDYIFDSVNVCTGESIHVAVVMDRSNQKAYCYIDGQLKQTMDEVTYPSAINITNPMGMGGDLRKGNGQYFKGEIYNITLYKDMRTAQEILSDVSAKTPEEDNIVLAYMLQNNESPDEIRDISGNGNNLFLHQNTTWITKQPALKPYEYSFAVVGDTQIVNRDYPQRFSGIYDWILDNVERYNTKFIFGLGDITDDNTPREYALADAVFQRLKGVIPFSFVRGNHDKTAQYNEYFTIEKYGDQVSGYYDGKMENTYHKFNVGNIKYMAVNIDCGASDAMLAWANEVCEANPDRNIIVTTHGYIGADGDVLSGSTEWPSRWGPNDGGEIWDKFIKKHKNIVLVICGHSTSDKVVMTKKTGDNGNVVTQLLIDPQGVDAATDGGVGLVAMLHFSKDGKNVQVRYYSTIKKAYYMPENQFEFTIETTPSNETFATARIVDSSLNLVLPPDSENKGTIALDTDKYTYTVDADEKSSLILSIETGNYTKGKVIVALYDKHTRLRNVKIYDSAASINAVFDDVYSGDRVRVIWWNGSDTLMPIGNDK